MIIIAFCCNNNKKLKKQASGQIPISFFDKCSFWSLDRNTHSRQPKAITFLNEFDCSFPEKASNKKKCKISGTWDECNTHTQSCVMQCNIEMINVLNA